jgi:flagellar biosynthesis protein FlhG
MSWSLVLLIGVLAASFVVSGIGKDGKKQGQPPIDEPADELIGEETSNEITEEQRDNFIKMLSKLEDIDYIIMDTGAGINKSVLGFITCCDYLFVVTTPEPTAITDAYSLIKVVDYFKIKNSASIIINKVFDNIEGEKVFNKFNAAVNRFLSINLNYLGCISEDRKLVQAVKNQVPVVINFPSSAASEDIRNIVQKLLGVKSIKKDSGIQQLFKRIFDIFS